MSSKFSSSKFSEFVKDVNDLYNLALRNKYYLPKRSSSAVNEVMIYNVLQKIYWCPKFQDIKMMPCVKAPVKEVLLQKLQALCEENGHNIAWIDSQHMPDKDWMVKVIGTLNPEDEIFGKDYEAPPIRKRLQDIETIILPDELFQGLPKSKSKVKARRLKIMSEAFAAEKTQRLKEIRRNIDEEILDQEVRVEQFKLQKQARENRPRVNILEEELKEEVKDMIKP
jgi:hypothetical protein